MGPEGYRDCSPCPAESRRAPRRCWPRLLAPSTRLRQALSRRARPPMCGLLSPELWCPRLPSGPSALPPGGSRVSGATTSQKCAAVPRRAAHAAKQVQWLWAWRGRGRKLTCDGRCPDGIGKHGRIRLLLRLLEGIEHRNRVHGSMRRRKRVHLSMHRRRATYSHFLACWLGCRLGSAESCPDLLGNALCTVLPFVPQMVGLVFQEGTPKEHWYTNSWCWSDGDRPISDQRSICETHAWVKLRAKQTAAQPRTTQLSGRSAKSREIPLG